MKLREIHEAIDDVVDRDDRTKVALFSFLVFDPETPEDKEFERKSNEKLRALKLQYEVPRNPNDKFDPKTIEAILSNVDPSIHAMLEKKVSSSVPDGAYGFNHMDDTVYVARTLKDAYKLARNHIIDITRRGFMTNVADVADVAEFTKLRPMTPQERSNVYAPGINHAIDLLNEFNGGSPPNGLIVVK